MTVNELFDIVDKHSLVPETEPWKWGHEDIYKLPDGRSVSVFMHCQEGAQEVIVNGQPTQ